MLFVPIVRDNIPLYYFVAFIAEYSVLARSDKPMRWTKKIIAYERRTFVNFVDIVVGVREKTFGMVHSVVAHLMSFGFYSCE